MFFDSLIGKFGHIVRFLRLLGSHLLRINTKTRIKKAFATKLKPKGAAKPKELNMCIIGPIDD